VTTTLDPVDRVRQAEGVLVLGMHRSGTSATTRVLNLCGLALGDRKDLWLSLPGNETGYWESSSLSRFNERLLAEAGGSWWCPPPRRALRRLAAARPLLTQGAELFERLYADEAWLWKDPRLCLTVPFWRAALATQPAVVLVVRHPFEVADSLAARDRMPRQWALALWERYVARSLTGVAGLPVYILSYARLLSDTMAVLDDLFGFLTARGLPVKPPRPAAVADFLRLELRHTRYEHHDLLHSGVTRSIVDLLDIVESRYGAHDRFHLPPLPSESAPGARLLRRIGRDGATGTLPKPALLDAGEATPTGEETSSMLVTAAREAPPMSLTADWRRWITENLLLRVADDDLVTILVRHGIGPGHARAEIDSVRTDPCYQAAEQTAQQLRKIESLLDIVRDLALVDPARSQVDHMPVLTREQFRSRYYADNRPVLLEGLVDDWPALRRWSPRYLRDTVPDALIEVMADRAGDAEYEINSELHRTTVRMADYVDAVTSGGPSNDVYLVANNHFFDNPDVAVLKDDFAVPGPYLDPAAAAGSVFFWFGPGGTVTPLHHDVANVLFVQVHGTKRITLVPALQVHRLYNDVGVYTGIDPDKPDPERFPLFTGTTPLQVTLGPGQALFIPVGWWHRVEALEVSISMSFTNFVFPNDYVWQHPERRG
jgi:hypothetical protein